MQRAPTPKQTSPGVLWPWPSSPVSHAWASDFLPSVAPTGLICGLAELSLSVSPAADVFATNVIGSEADAYARFSGVKLLG